MASGGRWLGIGWAPWRGGGGVLSNASLARGHGSTMTAALRPPATPSGRPQRPPHRHHAALGAGPDPSGRTLVHKRQRDLVACGLAVGRGRRGGGQVPPGGCSCSQAGPGQGAAWQAEGCTRAVQGLRGAHGFVCKRRPVNVFFS